MADYHTVYKGPEGETTQWEDIQRKLGNLPAKAPVWKPDAYAPEAEEAKDATFLDLKDEQELEELEDSFQDDRFLEEYRQKRIQELHNAQRKPRFGSVEFIKGNEFVQKVTNAGDGIWVVVHLYKEGHAACTLLAQCLDELAGKHPGSKFLKIISTDCIPNYPDINLPTVLVYNNGACKKNLVGLLPFGGRHVTPEQVALVLNQFGPICKTSEEENEDLSTHRQIQQLVNRVLEKKQEEVPDESSDFED